MLANAKIKAFMLPPFKQTCTKINVAILNNRNTTRNLLHCQDIRLRPYTRMDALLGAISKRFFLPQFIPPIHKCANVFFIAAIRGMIIGTVF